MVSAQGDCREPPEGVHPSCLRPRQCVMTARSDRSVVNVPSTYSRTQRTAPLWLHNLYFKVATPEPNDLNLAVVWYPPKSKQWRRLERRTVDHRCHLRRL